MRRKRWNSGVLIRSQAIWSVRWRSRSPLPPNTISPWTGSRMRCVQCRWSLTLRFESRRRSPQYTPFTGYQAIRSVTILTRHSRPHCDGAARLRQVQGRITSKREAPMCVSMAATAGTPLWMPTTACSSMLTIYRQMSVYGKPPPPCAGAADRGAGGAEERYFRPGTPGTPGTPGALPRQAAVEPMPPCQRSGHLCTGQRRRCRNHQWWPSGSRAS